MTCHIDCIDESGIDLPMQEQRLQKVLDRALADHEMPISRLTILLLDDSGSAELHGLHFNDATETDVMTFPNGDHDPETGLLLLGDLAVNCERAMRLGPDHHPGADHPASDELTLYIVHGLLHLLGYNDKVPADQQEMWTEQRRLLALIDISLSESPEP